MTGVAIAMAVGTGVATGMVDVAFTGGGVVAVAAATWADSAGDSTGSARGATILEAGAVGLGVAVAVGMSNDQTIWEAVGHIDHRCRVTRSLMDEMTFSCLITQQPLGHQLVQ